MDRSEAAQLYAGGADTTCLRTSLALAASRAWHAASLDIKTAFLNAPLQTLQESSKKKAMALEDAHGRHQEETSPQLLEDWVEEQCEQGPEGDDEASAQVAHSPWIGKER